MHTSRRRRVNLTDLSQVAGEVRLLASGHRTVGDWTLGQICRHMADTIDASMDGFDLRRHRFKRAVCGKLMLRLTFRFGIPSGYSVDDSLSPPLGAELDQALIDLERAVARFKAHRVAFHPHPLFGRLSRAAWDRLHRFHCGHHLSFAVASDETPRSS